MKIFIGLGNPGKKFESTRHNAGFLMLDKIQKDWELPDFAPEKKFQAEISRGKVNEEDIFLIKPQTFMNLSGEIVRSVLDFYKLDADSIVVIHDDIDIPLGKFKIATDSSSAGHNGVQNIIENLGTKKFKRVRIGVGKTEEEKESCPISAHDFVLGKFSSEELETIEKLYPEILEETKKLL